MSGSFAPSIIWSRYMIGGGLRSVSQSITLLLRPTDRRHNPAMVVPGQAIVVRRHSSSWFLEDKEWHPCLAESQHAPKLCYGTTHAACCASKFEGQAIHISPDNIQLECVWATRNPTKTARNLTGPDARLAARRSDGGLFHAPPRNTRREQFPFSIL